MMLLFLMQRLFERGSPYNQQSALRRTCSARDPKVALMITSLAAKRLANWIGRKLIKQTSSNSLVSNSVPLSLQMQAQCKGQVRLYAAFVELIEANAADAWHHHGGGIFEAVANGKHWQIETWVQGILTLGLMDMLSSCWEGVWKEQKEVSELSSIFVCRFLSLTVRSVKLYCLANVLMPQNTNNRTLAKASCQKKGNIMGRMAADCQQRNDTNTSSN